MFCRFTLRQIRRVSLTPFAKSKSCCVSCLTLQNLHASRLLSQSSKQIASTELQQRDAVHSFLSDDCAAVASSRKHKSPFVMGATSTKSRPFRQWQAVKDAFPDCIVFFQLGKFYELLKDDAYFGRDKLGLRVNSLERAGFPDYCLSHYLSKAVGSGAKVAVVDEVATVREGAKQFKRREVVRVVSPGTFLDYGSSDSLDDGSVFGSLHNRFVVSICHRIAALPKALLPSLKSQSADEKHWDLPKNVLKTNLRSTQSAGASPRGGNPEVAIVACDVSTAECFVTQCLASEMVDRICTFHKVEDILVTEDSLTELSFLKQTLDERGLKMSIVKESAQNIVDETAIADGSDIDSENQRGNAADLSTEKLCTLLHDFEDCFESRLQLNAFVNLWKYIELSNSDVEMKIENRRSSERMAVGYETRKALEMTETLYEGTRKGSLMHALDNCSTPMGSRLLLNRLLSPSRDPSEIRFRLDLIAYFKEDTDCAKLVSKRLKEIGDFQRQSRLGIDGHSLNVLYGVATAIQKIALLSEMLCTFGNDEFYGAENEEQNIAAYIRGSVECSKQLLDWSHRVVGIKQLASAKLTGDSHLEETELDAIESEDVVTATSKLERELLRYLKRKHDTGINSKRATIIQKELNRLCHDSEECRDKVIFKLDNSTDQFGYSVRLAVNSLPSHLDAKSFAKVFDLTFCNATKQFYRFKNKALKQLQREHLQAHNKVMDLLLDFRRKMAGELRAPLLSKELFALSQALAQLDLSASHAQLAVDRLFCEPTIVDNCSSDGEELEKERSSAEEMATGSVLEITDGRHPIVEGNVSDFEPNSLAMSNGTAVSNRLTVLTGANMGGKSVFLRQCAILAIMAQSGLNVPATAMRLTPLDACLAHLCGTDRIALNSSSFMTEMKQVSHILANCTQQSLVFMDETCRGTSPSEGCAIALAFAKHLFEDKRCLTLFSTHFFEVPRYFEMVEGAQNKQMSVSQEHGESDALFYDHRVVDGYATHSHALFVARCAGIPEHVLSL